MTGKTPAGAGHDGAVPAGTSGHDGRAAQRDTWRRTQAAWRRGQRRRRTVRGRFPGRAGMIRRPPPEPPEDGDAA